MISNYKYYFSYLFSHTSAPMERPNGAIYHPNKMCVKTHRLLAGGRMVVGQENGHTLHALLQTGIRQYALSILEVQFEFYVL